MSLNEKIIKICFFNYFFNYEKNIIFPVLSFACFFRWNKLKIHDWFDMRVEEVSDSEFGEEDVDELLDAGFAIIFENGSIFFSC